jgi:protein-S-isoprenylcysteine O-methyltransferase Ste14
MESHSISLRPANSTEDDGLAFALIPATLAVAVLVVRTSLEDKTLHRELPGYADYATEVPHRLLPGLW